VLSQPFEVELVGGEWWAALIPLVGPFVIALGALAGAWLTVRTADRRHRAQLEHDQDLQQRRLEHDRKLRRLELEHDRTLRYREHVYGILDDVIERTQELVSSVNMWDHRITTTESDRSEFELREREAPTDVDRENVRRKRVERDFELLRERAELYTSLANGWGDNIRLSLRLGKHHDLAKLHEGLLEALKSRAEVVSTDVPPLVNRTTEQIKADEQRMDQISDAQASFLEACEAWHLDPPIDSGD
jgi:hypothetical protein